MTKLSDFGEPIFSDPLMPTANDEHFYTCKHCGQLVDRRDLNQVIWHEIPDHTPIEMDD